MPEAPEELPAARRREVELARGVVLLPPVRGAEEALPPERPRFVPPPMIPGWVIPTVIASAVIAVVALVLAASALSSLSTMKSQIREAIVALEALRAREIALRTFFIANHTGTTEMPLARAIPKFAIPLRGVIPVKIVDMPIIDPMTGVAVRKITLDANITVDYDLPIDPSNITGVMTIRYAVAPEGEVVIIVKLRDIFAQDFDAVIDKLKKIAS